MAVQTPRAVFIGPENVGNVLVTSKPSWKWYPSVPDIEQFWTLVQNGSISPDVECILVIDSFFDPKGNDVAFEQFVSTSCPHTFVGIVNYHPSLNDQMRETISKLIESSDSDGFANFYFIDTRGFKKSFDFALNAYASNSSSDPRVAAILKGIDPDEIRKVEPVVEEAEEIEFTVDPELEESPYLGQVVAVTSSKGGSGKSTVTMTTATYLAHSSVNSVRQGLEERPLKILVLDLDVRDGQTGFMTGDSSPTVLKLMNEGISKKTIESTVIHKKNLKLDILLAPKRPRLSDEIPIEFYVELISNLKKMYDYVFLDTSVNYLDPLLEKVAYPMADQIVFVTDMGLNSVFSMTRWVKEVTSPRENGGMGINKNKIGIVVNKSISDVNMTASKIRQSAVGIPVVTAVPSSPKLVTNSLNLRSMERLLQHEAMFNSFSKLARGIVGKKYNLSDDVTP